MSTGFAAGVGSTHREMCGALSAGIMIIGALRGRTSPDVDDEACQQLAAAYRARFQEEFGLINCGELREEKFGSSGEEPCSVLVQRAAGALLDCLADHAPSGE